MLLQNGVGVGERPAGERGSANSSKRLINVRAFAGAYRLAGEIVHCRVQQEIPFLSVLTPFEAERNATTSKDQCELWMEDAGETRARGGCLERYELA